MIATLLPSRRPDLILDRGVLEDPRTGDFYTLGPEEAFLLLALDGKQTAADLTAAFEERFGAPLAAEDVDDFVALARSNGFIGPSPSASEASSLALGLGRKRQSILYWRATV